eukprot:scaffold2814_cov154-Isochrysis_galbana.AAC.2
MITATAIEKPALASLLNWACAWADGMHVHPCRQAATALTPSPQNQTHRTFIAELADAREAFAACAPAPFRLARFGCSLLIRMPPLPPLLLLPLPLLKPPARARPGVLRVCGGVCRRDRCGTRAAVGGRRLWRRLPINSHLYFGPLHGAQNGFVLRLQDAELDRVDSLQQLQPRTMPQQQLLHWPPQRNSPPLIRVDWLRLCLAIRLSQPDRAATGAREL